MGNSVLLFYEARQTEKKSKFIILDMITSGSQPSHWHIQTAVVSGTQTWKLQHQKISSR